MEILWSWLKIIILNFNWAQLYLECQLDQTNASVGNWFVDIWTIYTIIYNQLCLNNISWNSKAFGVWCDEEIAELIWQCCWSTYTKVGNHCSKAHWVHWSCPRVQLWKSYHSFLSGSQGGEAVALWDRRLLRETNGCGERRALTAVKMFAYSLRFLECVCVCVQMGEHQTHIVTYCFLLNTWPQVKTTDLVRRPKTLTSCTGGFPQQTSQYISHHCNTQSCFFFKPQRELWTLICHFETALACWNQ